jgi:hypothetical protein
MLRYISTLLLKFKHPQPTKPRLSLFKCRPTAYGAKAQLILVPDTSELLDDNHKRCIQEIVGALLYYARVVDNKLLVAISTISARQSKTTIATEQAVNLLFDYAATHPNDGIAYQSSNMILCTHADEGFLNKTKSHSRGGAHIFLLEDAPYPHFNASFSGVVRGFSKELRFWI